MSEGEELSFNDDYSFRNCIRERERERENFLVFNATFNNISTISWPSVLLVEETGENHRPIARQWQSLLHNVVSSTPRHERDSNRER